MLLGVTEVQAVDFIFVNGDGPGEGLNDTTAVAPIGGNPATTLGAQRLAALERVGEIWGTYLSGNVPIRVLVEFDNLAEGTLAGASPRSVQRNFANAPRTNVWYPVALANQLANADLEPFANDIEVTANSNGTFYYGFDSANPGNQTNFIDVLLHELGHGLGFISLVDLTTGNFYSGQTDVFTSLVFDQELNAAWPSLTAGQRLASATNDPDLVWTGPFSTGGLTQKLNRPLLLTATFPDQTTRQIAFMEPTFDGAFPAGGLTRNLAITNAGGVDPNGACGTITNSNEVAGKIAFVRRGTCDFDSKVYAAQQAGAVAVIIADNVVGPLLSPSGDSLVNNVPVNIVIPAAFISKADGDALLAGSPGVQLSFTPLPGDLQGANDGQLRLYAPSAISSGSSVSHWSDTASPDLLMEPFINPGLDRRLDLTLTQMKDIGWKVIDIPFPYLTYDSWKSQVFTTADSPTDAAADFDRDGVSNLEEYFFGSDPKVPDSNRLPTFQFTSGDGILVYTRSKLFTDLTFGLEKSTTLTDFTPAVQGVDYEIVSTTSLGSGAEQVTLRILNGPAKLFLRLRITQ